MFEMEQTESPSSSDSAHTPLLDEHISCEITAPINLEIGEAVDIIEEQLDYEEFIENNEETKPESEAEEGEYTSADDNDILVCEVEDKQLLENGELHNNDENSNEDKKSISKHGTINESSDEKVIKDDVKCDGELAEGELKAEEEEMIIEETPWERGLRLARERRELAKLKKVQEKDNLKERQLHINLENIEEVEPISKPQIEKSHEVNHKLLKALQPIVILPEEPRPNEMLLEYYLAELDYQHRPRFIPSRLYTLDPWEVEEWKRELDMMKMESEMERIASNKRKRILDSKSLKGRRQGSISSTGSSRSSSQSGMFNQTNRTYEFQTSQYALSRNKPILNKNDKPFMDDSMRKSNIHHGQRDLPPEFKNRILSSSRSSSRSSSGSHSSSSGSSSSSRSTSSLRDLIKKRGNATLPTSLEQKRHGPSTTQPIYRTIKKPALGRGRSDSSYSSRSSDSSSSSSNGSSSQSSESSDDSRKGKKSKNDKEFINSWFTKTTQNQLEATIVPESALTSSVLDKDEVNGSLNHANNLYDVSNTSNVVMGPDNNDCELPSASTRPGVKLKLVTRPKPIILPNQTTKSTSKNLTNEKGHRKADLNSSNVANSTTTTTGTSKSNTVHSSIFQNNKSIFSTSSINTTGSKSNEISQTAKESALKSNLAATKLEMQQEFLRNYKDKIAIYRSQLSYQQQNPISGQHPGTLIHTQPPPIKGPITVMSVTSKKTGPPKTHVKVTDRYSQHEEHSHRHNHHHSNYRNEFRENVNASSNSSRNKYDNNRNRSRSFENDRRGESGDWRLDRSQGNHDRDRNYFGDKPGIMSRDYDNKFRQSSDNFRAPRNSNTHEYNDKFRDNNYRSSFNDNSGNKFRESQHDKYGRSGDRGRFEGSDRDRDRGRNDFDRTNRSDRGLEDRTRREDRNNRNQRDFNRSKDQEQEQYSRKERPRDRFRESEREFENRFSENTVTKRSEVDNRDHNFESSKSLLPSRNSRNLDRENIDSTNTANHANEEVSVPKPALIPAAVVPKEKRREELLKQLKAVEDAIAKKKAKIDK